MINNIRKGFTPHHITVNAKDLEGNKGKGVYFYMPGSPGRAKSISKQFEKVTKVFESERGHTIYIGYITDNNGNRVDVGSVASGMGTPSIEIIVTELIFLGVQVILRIGTCGALQPWINTGDFIVATGAVRDEQASKDYVPSEFPAIPGYKLLKAIRKTKKDLNATNVKFGIYHTKASFYSRQFGEGPMKQENMRYKDLLINYKVAVSEMETSLLFVLGQYYGITTGAISVSVSSIKDGITSKEVFKKSVEDIVKFSINVFKNI